MNINRRNFLKGTAAGAAATAVTGGVLIGGAHADAERGHHHLRPGDRGVVPVPRRAPVRGAHPRPGREAGVHLRRVLRRDGVEQGRAGRPDADDHRPRPVPDRRRDPGQPRGQPAAVGQRRARPGDPGRRPDRDAVGRLDAVRRPLRPRRGQAGQAHPDDRLPQRLARARLARRRPAAPALRQPPRHDPPRDQGHHQAHPRRHAAGLEDGGLQLAAPPVGHLAEPARLQGRHRQPDRRDRDRPGLGGRPGRAVVDGQRVVRGGAADPDAGRILGPGVDQRAGDDVRPAPGQRRPARRQQRVRHARTTRRTRRATSSRSTRTSGWPTRAPPRPPTSGSSAAPTTTTSASTSTATCRPGTSSSATSRTWSASS